jgi:hypothetical protein
MPNQATRLQHGMPIRVQQITPKGNHNATWHERTAANHGKRQLECNTASAYSCKTRQKASNMQLCTRVKLQNTAKRQAICNCSRAYSCKQRQKATRMQHGTRVQLKNTAKGKQNALMHARARYLSSASCSSVSLHQRVSGKSAQWMLRKRVGSSLSDRPSSTSIKFLSELPSE